ncbi:hypothetical protein OIE66_06380 [Nonomuraea sp. NBC_01738]|uniref:hypothetical protein n=1 Tax=Nonomuraea sp. NBC_01738 TaxID=2976003 RepID=UPI002E0F4848|nr:hypothetical protein OIE66_06380 [Nonomuraea sp. NBC_01738]
MGESEDGAARRPNEQDELVRLRAEVKRLKAGRSSGRWRGALSAVLITLGCLLLPLAAVGVWAANEISDTDRYVENVAPLSQDPDIQAAVIERTTDEIMARIPVQQILDEALKALNLPPRVEDRLDALAGPLTSGVSGFVGNAVERVVHSDVFTTFWREANTFAHTQLVGVLSGEGTKSVKVDSDSVTLDLGPLIAKVKENLTARGFGLAGVIPDIHPTITLVESTELAKYQTWYQVLVTLKWVLPLLALVLIALGVWVARSHRRALVGAGIGVMLAMLALWVGLAIGQNRFLNAITQAGFDRPAAQAAFDLLTRFLEAGVRMLFVVGLVFAVAAFFTGPSHTAVRTRNGLSSGIARARGGLDTGAVGSWTGRYRRMLQIAACLVAVVVFVVLDRPSGWAVLGIAVGLLVVLGIIEFLAKDDGESPSTPAPA